VLLGTGVAAMGLGALLIANAGDFENQTVGSYVLFFGGFGASLTSIPFFISASGQKHKAKLALKGEQIGFERTVLPHSSYTALSITMPL
jgi:hypothetical protein